MERFSITEWILNDAIFKYFVKQRDDNLDAIIKRANREIASWGESFLGDSSVIRGFARARKEAEDRKKDRFSQDGNFFHNLTHPRDVKLFYRLSLLSQLREGLTERGIDWKKAIYVSEYDLDPNIEYSGNPHQIIHSSYTDALRGYPTISELIERLKIHAGDLDKVLEEIDDDVWSVGRRAAVIAYATFISKEPYNGLIIGKEDAYANSSNTLDRIRGNPVWVKNGLSDPMALFVYDGRNFQYFEEKHKRRDLPILDVSSEDLFVHNDPTKINESLQAIVQIDPYNPRPEEKTPKPNRKAPLKLVYRHVIAV